MTTQIAQLFFDYEEAVSLYVETDQEACRLRAIVLRRDLLDRLLGEGWIENGDLLASGQMQVPKWMVGEN